MPGSLAGPLTLVAAICFLMAVATLAYSFVGDANQRKARQRLEEAQLRLHGVTKEVKMARLKRTDAPTRLAGLDNLLRRLLPNREQLVLRLNSTGRNISVGDYALWSIGLALAVAVPLLAVAGFSFVTAALAGIAVGAGVPHFAVGRMAQKRADLFNAGLPDAIDLMVRGLRAGLPVQETIGTVAREVAAPVGPLFEKVQQEIQFGVQIETAFWKVSKQINVHELDFLIISMSIQRETGGNLAETLANLATLLRARRQLKLKIKAFTSEARATSIILGSLPFLVCGGLYYMNPGYMERLFTDPRGQMMGAGAFVSLCIGLFVMHRLAKFKI